jgi:hypothetical protein
MTLGEVHRTVGRAGRHGPLRTLSSLSHVDYGDAFALETAVVATPEEWARAIFGDIPDAAERLIWRGCLGLRLRPAGADVIAGWPVTRGGPHWIRLENRSAMLAGNLVVRIRDGQVALGVFVRYHRRRGRLVWSLLAPIHRLLAPRLLHDAETTIRQRSGRCALDGMWQTKSRGVG